MDQEVRFTSIESLAVVQISHDTIASLRIFRVWTFAPRGLRTSFHEFVCFFIFLADAETQTSKLHLAVQRDYPNAEQLPLPENINVSETARFSPLRNRDITSSAISVHHEMNGIDVTLDQFKPEAKTEAVSYSDPHLGSYDRHGSVNLSSVMQSTVPEPFGGNSKLTHLNMPGGQWGQQTKYLSHELNSSHYTQLRQESRESWSQYEQSPKGIKSMIKLTPAFNCSLNNRKCLFDRHHQSHFLIINKRFISLSAKLLNEQVQQNSQKSTGESKEVAKETAGMKLKKAVKEYGSTVVVFHVGISLMSLGMFYALVSRFVSLTNKVFPPINDFLF